MGTEGYSPAVLRRVVRQASKSASFREASEDLWHLASVRIRPSQVRKITQRIGQEWADARDADVAAFREGGLPSQCHQTAPVAAVYVDGGRVQTRDEDAERGVHNPGWREDKVACLETLSAPVSAVDPQPQPPQKFLDPERVSRMTAEIKGSGHGSKKRAKKEGKDGQPDATTKKSKGAKKGKGARKGKRSRSKQRRQKRVRTVIASMANSEGFGWQVAAEVQRRGLGQAQRKAYICDGQKYNWTLYEMHLVCLGFVAILDVVHLLAYLYAAAQALEGKGTVAAWGRYEKWLRLAWSGKVSALIEELRAGCARLGDPPPTCGEEDVRRVLAETLGYVENNRGRMKYAEYRRQGLPISSAPVESVMKQVNRRMKGTEKFWVESSAEALLQLRAAYLSEDERAERYWARPRPRYQAVGSGRLRQPA